MLLLCSRVLRRSPVRVCGSGSGSVGERGLAHIMCTDKVDKVSE
jgi:hypothetical protein